MSELHIYPCPECGGLTFRVSISVGRVIGFECKNCGKVLPKEHAKKRRVGGSKVRWRPQPTITFAPEDERQDEQNEYVALYRGEDNRLMLTPLCNEGNIVASLVHELTHWAQTLGMTNREIKVESDRYAENLRTLGYDRWSELSLVERMAEWVEDECL